MINHSPAGEMAVITGSSVHNQKVERFNRDLNIRCAVMSLSQSYMSKSIKVSWILPMTQICFAYIMSMFQE